MRDTFESFIICPSPSFTFQVELLKFATRRGGENSDKSDSAEGKGATVANIYAPIPPLEVNGAGLEHEGAKITNIISNSKGGSSGFIEGASVRAKTLWNIHQGIHNYFVRIYMIVCVITLCRNAPLAPLASLLLSPQPTTRAEQSAALRILRPQKYLGTCLILQQFYFYSNEYSDSVYKLYTHPHCA